MGRMHEQLECQGLSVAITGGVCAGASQPRCSFQAGSQRENLCFGKSCVCTSSFILKIMGIIACTDYMSKM